MVDTGIECKGACIKAYDEEFRAKKLRYIFFNIVEDKETKEDFVDVDSLGTKEETFDDLVAKLRELEAQGEPRFCAFRLEYTSDSKGDQSKYIFITWVPNTVRLNRRMTFFGTAENLKRKLKEIYASFEVQRADDFTLSNVIKLCEGS